MTGDLYQNNIIMINNQILHGNCNYISIALLDIPLAQMLDTM